MLDLTNLGEALSRVDHSLSRKEMKVTCFGYRKSHTAGKLLAKLPRHLVRDLELCLAARTGTVPDNHTGYLVEATGAGTCFVYCSDQYIYISTEYVLGDF